MWGWLVWCTALFLCVSCFVGCMVDAVERLGVVARAFADVVPGVDERVSHNRWQPGLGAFEEEEQLQKLCAAVREDEGLPFRVAREVAYPQSDQRCDLVLSEAESVIPVEAKLVRFRRDNGDLEPAAYGTVFNPIAEANGSVVTDSTKLVESAFDPPYGLLGLYYERADETEGAFDAGRLAEKVRLDIEFWYGYQVRTVEVARFNGLRHPEHQQGAVIAWQLGE